MDVQTIDTTQRRLKILTADDLDALYGRPTFTPEERRYYFALSPPEQEALQEFRTIKARVWFILQLGYFKAKHVFVPCELAEIHEDLMAISSPPTFPRLRWRIGVHSISARDLSNTI